MLVQKIFRECHSHVSVYYLYLLNIEEKNVMLSETNQNNLPDLFPKYVKTFSKSKCVKDPKYVKTLAKSKYDKGKIKMEPKKFP